MEVRFSRPFEKDLKSVSDKRLVLKVDEIIESLKEAESLSGISNIKKIKGHIDCYRIRIGNYRLGLLVENKTIWLARLMDRKEIYRYFP